MEDCTSGNLSIHCTLLCDVKNVQADDLSLKKFRLSVVSRIPRQ